MARSKITSNFLKFKKQPIFSRWVNNGVLKPAFVEMYKEENIFDKQKCIELLKALSSQRSVQASYARKILAKMGIDTDKLSLHFFFVFCNCQ